MVELALARGVDFSTTDPADRDGRLRLSLLLRAQTEQIDLSARVEAGRQTLALLATLTAGASRGRKELYSLWDRTLDKLENDLRGVETVEKSEGPLVGSTDELKAEYVRRFGDPTDPEFVAHDRAVADWLSRGGDLKGEPMPVRRPVTDG